jgi:hypothetical protein
VGVDVEDARLYFDAPLETFADSTAWSSLRSMPASGDLELRDALERANLVYIFARRDSLKVDAPWRPYLKRDFLDRFATRIFEDSETVVYRLRD